MKARATESPHRPSLFPEELRAIDQDAKKFLGRFSRVHAAAIARNTVAVRHRLVRLISGRFQLKRGPKPDPQIVQAHEMLRQGVKTRELIRKLLPGFDALDAYGQHLVRKAFYSKLTRYEQAFRKGSQENSSKTQPLKSSRNSEDENLRETRG